MNTNETSDPPSYLEQGTTKCAHTFTVIPNKCVTKNPAPLLSCSNWPLPNGLVQAVEWRCTMSTPHSPMFHQSLNRNLNLQSSATNTVRSKACVASVSKNVPLSLSLSVFLLGFTTTKEISGSHLEAEKGNKNYAKYDVGLGRSPGMTNCPKCERQVETVVDYKAGTYAWLMCLLFICCGWVNLGTSKKKKDSIWGNSLNQKKYI